MSLLDKHKSTLSTFQNNKVRDRRNSTHRMPSKKFFSYKTARNFSLILESSGNKTGKCSTRVNHQYSLACANVKRNQIHSHASVLSFTALSIAQSDCPAIDGHRTVAKVARAANQRPRFVELPEREREGRPGQQRKLNNWSLSRH